MGFAKCSKLVAEELAAAQAAASASANNQTAAPPLTSMVGQGAAVEDLILTTSAGPSLSTLQSGAFSRLSLVPLE